ncbi:MAG: alpha amylase C-terminal domain-containing protein, partial [Gammaproteobacteria bacterium]
REDHHPDGFRWVDVESADTSVFAFERRAPGEPTLLCAFNATPVPRPAYWLGVDGGCWRCVLDTDAGWMGGADWSPQHEVTARPVPCHGRPLSLVVDLPALGARFFERVGGT